MDDERYPMEGGKSSEGVPRNIGRTTPKHRRVALMHNRNTYRDRSYRDRSYRDRSYGDRSYGDRSYRGRSYRDRPYRDRPYRDRHHSES